MTFMHACAVIPADPGLDPGESPHSVNGAGGDFTQALV
jgi:hypothetical protein